MKNLLFSLKAVQTGTHKAEVGAGAETFWESDPELEPKEIVLAPQHRYRPWNVFSAVSWICKICLRIRILGSVSDFSNPDLTYPKAIVNKKKF